MKRPKSKHPRKQRKFLYSAPLHIRRKMMSAHLSKELIKKYSTRSMPVRKGDEVEVMRGRFKKRTGKIARLNTKKYRVYIEGIMIKRTDGTERQAPIHPSKLRITKLNIDDKKRLEAIKRKGGKVEETPQKIKSA